MLLAGYMTPVSTPQWPFCRMVIRRLFEIVLSASISVVNCEVLCGGE